MTKEERDAVNLERAGMRDVNEKLLAVLTEHSKALSVINDVLSQYEENFNDLRTKYAEVKGRLDHLQGTGGNNILLS